MPVRPHTKFFVLLGCETVKNKIQKEEHQSVSPRENWHMWQPADCSIVHTVGSCPGFWNFTARTVEWANVWTLETASKKSNLNDLYLFPTRNCINLWSGKSHHTHRLSMSLGSQDATRCQGQGKQSQRKWEEVAGLCAKIPWNSGFRDEPATTSALWRVSEVDLNHQRKSHSGTVLLPGRHSRVTGTHVSVPQVLAEEPLPLPCVIILPGVKDSFS